MRTESKIYSSAYFSQLLLSKGEFFDLIKKLNREGEAVEIKIGSTIFEGLEEIQAHSESIEFPMTLSIGKLEVEIGAPMGNRIWIRPPDDAKIQSIIRELEAFRNPLQILSNFLPLTALIACLSFLLSVISSMLLSIANKVSPISTPIWLPFTLLIPAIILAFKIEKRGKNRFVRRGESFLARYADKIVPSVASSLLTAGLIWLVANWAAVKVFLGIAP